MFKKNSKTALAMLLAMAMMLSAAGCAGIPVADEELPETETPAVETEAPDAPADAEAVEPEAELPEDNLQTGAIEPQTLLAGGAIEVTPLSTSVTVPSNVTPVKSWSVTVGTTYKIPDDQKQTGDTYASSNTAIVTVNASTGQFTPQSAGVAYIVATNGGQSRYFKVTASAAGATATTAATTNVFDGYTVTVLNTTTVATRSTGHDYPITVYYFVAADGTKLGSISGDAYAAIMTKYNANTGVGTVIAPDGFDQDWSGWFAEQFNIYRGLSAGAGRATQADYNANQIEEYRQELIRLVNIEREKVGLSPYIVSDRWMEYSQTRAEELAESYSHTRPDGTDAGYEIIYASPRTPAEAVSGWMNSPGHKAAILHETRVYVGAGCYMNDAGNYYWEMYFAL